MPKTSELDERISKCQKILDEDPNSQIFAALAEAYRKKGELDKAFQVCQNGLRIHPSYGSAHLVMAKVNLDRGQYDWAEIEAQKAAEIDGYTRAVELLLAEVYIYKGEFSAAIKMLKRLHEADPQNTQISKLLEIARRLPEEQRQLAPQGPDAAATQEEAMQETATKRVETALNSQAIVQAAITLDGVAGSAFIESDGALRYLEWASSVLDGRLVVNSMSQLVRQMGSELVQTSFGNVESMLIECNKECFYVVPAHNGTFLFLVDQVARLGSFRMKVEGLLGRYQ
ncbi:tetratricopeptide repeat protein [candidate division GN15 bacterium]|nr:tetratricopeptide repeat protein [candidate division GN15 bacterium]